MPTAAGPNSNEQGLVFAIDLGDIKNSYVGEPTTNIVTNPTFLGTVNTQSGGPAKNWVFSGETTATGFQFYDADTAPIPLKFPEEGAVITKGPNAAGSNRRIYINTTLLPNTTYTFSCWMYFGKSFGSAWSQFQYDSSGTNLSSNYFPAFSTFAANNGYTTGEWFKWEGTLTTEPTASWCYIGPVISKGADCLVAMQRMQMEIKPHSTSFVNGARSSTQGLLDLTGNKTINLNNISFDSNSQITFDGTDDYITVTPGKQYTIAEPWTTELVFKPTDQNDTSWNGLFGGYLTVGGYWMFHSGGSLTYYEGHDSVNNSTKITYRSWNKENTFTAGVYHHLTIVYTPGVAPNGNFDIYYNGGQKVDSFVRTFTWNYSLDMQFIGSGSGNRHGTNDVHYFRQYSRSLSAEEVANNYNVLKKRFNI